MPKNKQQEAQEKRLQKNIRQAKKTGADAKQGKTKSARSKPSKKGGFFAGLKADAPQTVQQSIPYREMYRDGICRLTDTLYTKTVQFFDINYQLAQADDKAQIFEGYCDFLNYFDASIHVQLTFINQRANMQDFTKSIDIPPRGDEYDGIRKEYGDMLKNQLQKGNNGLTRDKLSRTFSSNSQKIHKKRCQKHRMASDTSFDRLHFSVQQVFAEIHIVWQLVDIWLPAPLDFRQFQRIGCFQRVIVARHI